MSLMEATLTNIMMNTPVTAQGALEGNIITVLLLVFLYIMMTPKSHRFH